MRYGLSKLFKRGIDIGILPTYVCNLDCEHCCNKFDREGNKFKSKELTPDDWYRLISIFPVKIRELHFTGGEPFLYKDIQELTLKLLSLGIHISLFSNLLIRRDMSKIKSDKFRIEATLHNEEDSDKFYSNVDYYRQWVRVDIDLWGDKLIERNRFDKVKYRPKLKEKDSTVCLDMKRFKITPDGRIWPNDREIGDTYTIPGGREVK